MYSETVTVFNRYESRLGDMWYPTVLHNVNVNIDKAGIVASYGEQSKDSIVVNIGYVKVGLTKFIGDKEYLLPKEWDSQTNDKLSQTVTFTDGENFDFIYCGEWSGSSAISDNDYLDGFYNYMNSRYDRVFAITSVSEFTVIPHLEITGK